VDRRGRAAAIWSLTRAGVTLTPLCALTDAGWAALDLDAADVRRFLGAAR
jgi:hypothetical protein